MTSCSYVPLMYRRPRSFRDRNARTGILVTIVASAMIMLAAPMAPAGAGTTSPVYELSVYASHSVTSGWPGSPYFVVPQDVAIDKNGNIYVADGNNAEVEKVTPQGVFSVIAGTGDRGTTVAGPATSTDLKDPSSVAVDSAGNIFVADLSESQVYEITPAGNLSIVAGTGNTGSPTPGPATSSNLWGPHAVAVDAHDNVFIADSNNNVVEKVTPSVNGQPGTLSIFAGNGNYNLAPSPGPATSSNLFNPMGLAIDAANNVYIAAELDNQILKVTPGGTLSIVAGKGSRGTPTKGAASSTAFDLPVGVAVDATGAVYASDAGDGYVTKISSGTISIIGGNGTLEDPTIGLATQSGFNDPAGLAVDAHGNLFVANDRTYGGDLAAAASAIEELSVLAPPSPPTSVVATPGNAQATVSFVAPTSTGGGAISNYTVTGHDLTNAARGGQLASGAASPLTLLHLTNGDRYTFTVTATSPGGTSVASSASAAVTPSTIPGVPSSPSAQSRYKGVALSWTAPASDGGSPILSYQIFKGSAAGGESATPVAVVNGSATSATITGLTAWSTYFFTIKAVNANGTSGASGERSAMASSDQLASPQTTLATFQQLFSPNNAYFAVLQGDGNFVVSDLATGAVLFQSETIGAKKGHLLTLSSGKLSLLNAANAVVWTPKAAKGSAAVLQLLNNGNLQLLSTTKTVLWTGTAANRGG